MHQGLFVWHYVCPDCRYEAALFSEAINNPAKHALINEDLRENGLRQLRVSNFSKIVHEIKTYLKTDCSKLLEVGPAHGWFLEIAEPHFKEITGIEPDRMISKKLSEKSFTIIDGYFPAALPSDNLFDVIVFNDVFEHIPNINSVLESVKNHLALHGLLVINLPSSEGFFYKLSKLISTIGLKSHFERMWQKEFPSPHIHYFNSRNLNELLQNHEFIQLQNRSLPSITLTGLYNRISHVSKNRFCALLIWLCVILVMPLVSFFESDVFFVIYTNNS